MYAIVETGGKQYRVEKGQVITVERLQAEVGQEVELERVLAVAVDDGALQVGNPLVSGARARARVVEHGRAPKIVVFKYKSKVNYRRKAGHRQPYTRLLIEDIVTGAGT
ncbi:MAG: 50S ribosomal protein L21 [Acetobacteraceae bacterium]|nr:50S ribosomal protein L21 [Acetobacteraceae bacterium]